MPRVQSRTKSNRGKAPFICRGCRKEILAGEEFYTWKQRVGGRSYRHHRCGYPRPSELSNAKTAVVRDAILDAEAAIAEWESNAVLDDNQVYSTGYDDVTTALEAVADEAQNVAEEYESNADNLPENLQYGYQAEAMRDVAQRLQDWADDLSSYTPDRDEPDMPEESEFADEAEFIEACQTELSDWASEVAGGATDLMGEIPEYEG